MVVALVAGVAYYGFVVGGPTTTITRSTTSNTAVTTRTTTTNAWPSGPNHPNVKLMCPAGTYLADHRCSSACPPGYQPVAFDLAYRPICMSGDNQPVSVYDLAGLQVSADNGRTVYLIVPTIPLTKVNISRQNFNTNIWLSVSQPVLEGLATAATIPQVTTEVATVGDMVGTFKILRMNQTRVEGNYTNPYPLCCHWQTKIIQIGDDVGIQCEGISEVLESIDFQDQVAVFTRTISQPGVCPICLSGDTLIDTSNGQVNVRNLTVGMPVWTVDASGKRVLATILEVRKTPVPSNDEIERVILRDGRQLFVSPGHPTADGRLFGQLQVGDRLDNSTVVFLEFVPYSQPFTYDLLPSGPTGFYWANGILVGSTLTQEG